MEVLSEWGQGWEVHAGTKRREKATQGSHDENEYLGTSREDCVEVMRCIVGTDSFFFILRRFSIFSSH